MFERWNFTVCSVTQSTGRTSTIGQEKRSNPALTRDEQTFVDELLAGLDAWPAYYAHMAPANSAGPAEADLSAPRRADAVLCAGARTRPPVADYSIVISVRSPAVTVTSAVLNTEPLVARTVPALAPITWTSDGWPVLQTVNGAWGVNYPRPNVPTYLANEEEDLKYIQENLHKLVAAGLLTEQRQGRHRYVRLADPRVRGGRGGVGLAEPRLVELDLRRRRDALCLCR